jgi:hypothetical protein
MISKDTKSQKFMKLHKALYKWGLFNTKKLNILTKKKLKELFKKLKEIKCTFVHSNSNYNKMLGCRL